MAFKKRKIFAETGDDPFRAVLARGCATHASAAVAGNRLKGRFEWVPVDIDDFNYARIKRATNPDDMEKVLNPEMHRENMKAFEWILERTAAPASVWAAWGAIITKRDYLAGCVRNMAEIGNRYGACWFTAGKRSKAGHPHHPLYLPQNSPLDPFDDLLPYLDSLSRS